MGRRKLVEAYYVDINNLSDLLNKLVNSYRLLIGGADELNKIALTKKKDVKHALDRANDLGQIIDRLIISLSKSVFSYTEYCELKSEIIKCKLEITHIETEIDEELKLKD